MRNHYKELTSALEHAEPDSPEQNLILMTLQEIESDAEEKNLVDLNDSISMKSFLKQTEQFKDTDTTLCNMTELKDFCLCELARRHYEYTHQ